MNTLFFTPGPSQLYPHLNTFLMDGYRAGVYSLSHRSEDFMRIAQTTKAELAKLLNIPKTHSAFFLGSSLESMERIMQNTQGKETFHITSGSFGEVFVSTARANKKVPKEYKIGVNDEINVEKLSISTNTALICITQNETSNGSSVSLASIQAIKKRYPDIPIAVDFVSSAPYPRINFQYIDYGFFSVQKGFGLPSGLGVLIVNRSVIPSDLQSGFHSLASLAKKEVIHQTPETPNVLAIYLLGKVAQLMNKKGITVIRRETDLKATMIAEFVQQNLDKLQFAVTNKKNRSKTVIVLDVIKGSKTIVKKLAKFRIIIGKGYGAAKDMQIRIANFPQHSLSDMSRLIKALERVL